MLDSHKAKLRPGETGVLGHPPAEEHAWPSAEGGGLFQKGIQGSVLILALTLLLAKQPTDTDCRGVVPHLSLHTGFHLRNVSLVNCLNTEQPQRPQPLPKCAFSRGTERERSHKQKLQNVYFILSVHLCGFSF